MLGTGTVSDPYQVVTWDDLTTGINDSAAYYKLMNDFDANDYNGGVWATITWDFKELDGAGYSIFNGFNTNPSITPMISLPSVTHTLKNIGFINFYSTGYDTFRYRATGNYRTCENVKIEAENQRYIFSNGNNMVIMKSTISHKRKSPILYPSSDYLDYQNCNVYLDFESETNSSMPQFLSYGRYAQNTTVRGKVKRAGTATFDWTFCNNPTNICVDVECEGFPTIGLGYDAGTGTSIINTDKLHGANISGLRSNHIAVTSEQMRDVGYLQSVGYPVALEG